MARVVRCFNDDRIVRVLAANIPLDHAARTNVRRLHLEDDSGLRSLRRRMQIRHASTLHVLYSLERCVRAKIGGKDPHAVAPPSVVEVRVRIVAIRVRVVVIGSRPLHLPVAGVILPIAQVHDASVNGMKTVYVLLVPVSALRLIRRPRLVKWISKKAPR